MNRDIASEVEDCIREGETNPELIAVLLGVSLSAVQEVLDKKVQNRSEKQVLLEEIEQMNALIGIAQTEYQNFSSNQNAQAIKTLQSARGELFKQLAAFEDPTANLQTLDSSVIAPMTRSLVLSVSRFIKTSMRELEGLVEPGKKAAVRELYDRNFRVLGSEFSDHYHRAIDAVSAYFALDVDIESLESYAEGEKVESIPDEPLPEPSSKKKRQIKRAGRDKND